MDVDESLPTARFRRQHGELFELAEQILSHRQPDAVRQQAGVVRGLLARFLGKLKIHAAMEEHALYPRLLADSDVTVRQTAEQLLKDVGPIYEEVFTLEKRWPDAAAVQTDPQGYIADVKRVLRRLGERVMRETAELYPLVDARR